MKRLLMFVISVLAVSMAVAADLPDPEKTPGVVEPKLTKERLCAPGFSTKAWRHVSAGDKAAAYRAYDMKPHEGLCADGRGCEVDHLVSLELGGSNSRKNLWPQPYETYPWNAVVKDSLENELHRMVCAGQISLEEAQTSIRTDWIATWKQVFGRESP